MSYLAQHIIDNNDLEGKFAKQAEEESAQNMRELYTPPVKPALAPAPEDPRSFAYDAPAGADDPTSKVGIERQRMAQAGVSQNETYRLLGGPRQRLGA